MRLSGIKIMNYQRFFKKFNNIQNFINSKNANMTFSNNAYKIIGLTSAVWGLTYLYLQSSNNKASLQTSKQIYSFGSGING